MLEQVSVTFSRDRWNEANRGQLSAVVAAEFPSIFVGFDHGEAAEPHLSASEWDRPDFDSFRFDYAVDELAARQPFTLRIADDRGERAQFPLEVLNRCQRLIDRRNRHSHGQQFDRILRRHRELHDLSKPLVHADYNHSLDVWQWVLRLDGSASLALQIAALFHDIERLVSEPERRVEHLAADYQQFKDNHAREGAAMTRPLLTKAGVAEAVCDRVAFLVDGHERPSRDPEMALLNDADALSFFSLNSSGYADYFGPEQTRKKVAYTWNRLRPESRAKLATVHLRKDVEEMVRALR
jgi:hypothetical protein